jgi:hypothetical protein
MKVKALIELLKTFDPEAYVKVGVSDLSGLPLDRLAETPAAMLYFHAEERRDCWYSGFPGVPAMSEVILSTGSGPRFAEADDPEAPGETAAGVVPPDFAPEAT